MTVQERVARGVALLDERYPGWERWIDLSDFDMADYEYCVLGQCFGRFNEGSYNLELCKRNAIECGFYDEHDYGKLEQEWIRVIQERRAVKQES